MLSAEALKWVWWGIATFGVAGSIALFVFAPSAGLILVNAVGKVLRFIISTRIGCAALAGVVVFFATDYHRARLDEQDWARQVAKFEAAQTARDAKIDQLTREAVQKELDAETVASTIVDKQKDAFDASLKPLAPTDRVCVVGADVIQLRLIAGSREAQGQAHRSMLAVGKRRSPARNKPGL